MRPSDSQPPRAFSAFVDRTAPAPFHYQLREQLRRRIVAGEWGAEEALPGEKALCEQAGVSRSVVRQALGDLVAEGVLVRRQGVGTFVAPPKITEGLAARESGFYEDMVQRGHEVTTTVIAARLEPATPQVAADLELPRDTDVAVVVRVREVDGIPTVYVESRLPADPFAELLELELGRHSLYAVIEERYGIRAGRSRRTLSAAAAEAPIAKLLDIRPHDPLIVLDSVSFSDVDGKPFETYRAYHRGDRTRFEVELLRSPDFGALTEPRLASAG
jgi:GntR family transcriptional regulator